MVFGKTHRLCSTCLSSSGFNVGRFWNSGTPNSPREHTWRLELDTLGSRLDFLGNHSKNPQIDCDGCVRDHAHWWPNGFVCVWNDGFRTDRAGHGRPGTHRGGGADAEGGRAGPHRALLCAAHPHQHGGRPHRHAPRPARPQPLRLHGLRHRIAQHRSSFLSFSSLFVLFSILSAPFFFFSSRSRVVCVDDEIDSSLFPSKTIPRAKRNSVKLGKTGESSVFFHHLQNCLC